MAVSLLGLVDRALQTAPGEARAKAGATLVPQLKQASGDLGAGLVAKRHFIEAEGVTSGGRLTFDPRFMLFEFVWNLLLRDKQVSTGEGMVK